MYERIVNNCPALGRNLCVVLRQTCPKYVVTMPKGRIRVRLKAYDSRIIDDCCQKILDTAVRTGARVVGPVPLPTEKEHFNVARSPFIDRNSREDFMIKTHKRLIDIMEPTDKTIDQLMHLDLPAGVDVEIKM